MSKENLKSRAKRILKAKVESETINYMGNEVTKSQFQKLLDEMDHDERSFALTRSRMDEVLNQLTNEAEKINNPEDELGQLQILDKEAQERHNNTKAIFDEYHELLNDDLPNGGESYLSDGIAYWINKNYLKTLYRKKKMVNYWKNH